MSDENEGETFVDVCSVDDENAWKGNKKISPIPTSPVEIGSGKVDLDLGASSTANDRGQLFCFAFTLGRQNQIAYILKHNTI